MTSAITYDPELQTVTLHQDRTAQQKYFSLRKKSQPEQTPTLNPNSQSRFKQPSAKKQLSKQSLQQRSNRTQNQSVEFETVKQYAPPSRQVTYNQLRSTRSSLDASKRMSQSAFSSPQKASIQFDPYTNQSLMSITHGSIVDKDQLSKMYKHQVKKYDCKTKEKRDRLTAFLVSQDFWDSDKFLVANHKRNNINSREGRKLNVSSYHKQMQAKPIRKDSKNAPFNKLSNYVIPSMKKRDDLRYQIRMKMHRASGLELVKPFTSPNKRSQSVKKLPKRKVSVIQRH